MVPSQDPWLALSVVSVHGLVATGQQPEVGLVGDVTDDVIHQAVGDGHVDQEAATVQYLIQ